MLCHIHPPPGRSSRHPAAGLADSRQDSGGAFGNSFTGDAFCGTSSFILAGHGTGGQCRSCEMPVPTSGRETDRNTKSACLAETSLTTWRPETRSSLPRFHVILLPHRLLSFNLTAHHAASAQSRLPSTSQDRQFAEIDSVHRADTSSAFRALPTLLGFDPSRPRKKLVARPLITRAIVSSPDGIQ